MVENGENQPSRHSSVKRARSISASLKGLFRQSSGKNANASSTSLNKSGPTSTVLTHIRPEQRGRRRSSNDNNINNINNNINNNNNSNISKLGKITADKATEIQNTRNNIIPPLSPVNKPKCPVNNHNVNVSANSNNPNIMLDTQQPLFSSTCSSINDLSPLQTPKIGKYNHQQITPIKLPNMEKLSLSNIPSSLLLPQDSMLSEEEFNQIDERIDRNSNKKNMNNNNNNNNGNNSEDEDSSAPTPTELTIDTVLGNKMGSRSSTGSRSRSRSLRKVNSSSSSISGSVASSSNAEQNNNERIYKGRPHSETVSMSTFPRFRQNSNSSSNQHINGSKTVPEENIPEPTCILQAENFKVFSNGTHEHQLKTIGLVSGECEPNNKTRGFSLSGFFKSHNKNTDGRLEGNNDNMDISEEFNFEDAVSLIPPHMRSSYSGIMVNSTNNNSNDGERGNIKKSGDITTETKKKYNDRGIPEVINPKAAVSSEELQLINTLSERIHAGLKHAADNQKNTEKDEMKESLDSDRLTFVEEYGKIIGKIGHGAYGVVCVSSRLVKPTDRVPLPTYTKDDKLFFAVKHVKPRASESVEKFSTKITSEFIIGHSLSRAHKKGDKISPNISKIIDLMEINDKFIEVMEFCPSGDLYSLLTRKYKNGTALHPLEADCFMKQLLHGIKFMHDRGVAHCDLKPENILFHPNGLLKICDFGTSCVFQTAWEKHVHFQSGAMGSEPYVAPEEFIRGKDYDPRLADCWSIGVVYCTMVLGRYLWKIAVREKDGFYNSFIEEMLEEKEFYVFEELRHINHDINRTRRVVLYKIFQWNPEKRITINQILQSPWMKRTRCCIPYKV